MEYKYAVTKVEWLAEGVTNPKNWSNICKFVKQENPVQTNADNLVKQSGVRIYRRNIFLQKCGEGASEKSKACCTATLTLA